MKFVNTLKTWAVKAALYLWKNVLPFVGGLSLLALLSFVVTGGFSFTTLSERIFYEAALLFLLGGTVAMSHMVSGRVLLFPFNIRRPEEAKRYVQDQPKIQAANEKRLDAGIQLWLIGLGTLAVSALIQTLLA